MVRAVRAELATNPERTLFLFGTYTIGKEAVFFSAAAAVGRKVYCGKAKREVLECLDLSLEEAGRITSDDKGAILHAVPMACVTCAPTGKTRVEGAGPGTVSAARFRRLRPAGSNACPTS